MAAVDKMLYNGVNNLHVGDRYVLPREMRPDMRPDMRQVSSQHCIPVIDLQDLQGPNRSSIVHQIKEACEEYGFFQIINHGVPEQVMKNMLETAREFFELPLEDKAKLYSEDPKDLARVSTSFDITKDKVLNWRDYLRHECHPIEEHINSWPDKPISYKDVARTYAEEMKSLIDRLLEAISEAMGQESEYLSKVFGKSSQALLTNFYPACPAPDLTLGIPAHSDPYGITVLLQGDVSGLQVLAKGKWTPVEPVPNAFVINLADQLEVISNGRFKSIEHRAVTNSKSARISIPTFYGPSMDAYISPASNMVDEEHPAMYRGYSFSEFKEVIWSQGLKSKSVLDHFKIAPTQ